MIFRATGPRAGVGGNGVLENGVSRTIDSIYLRYPNSTGWTGYTGIQDIQIDFVAKSDSGSIAGLLNSPPTVVDQIFNSYNANEPGEPQTLTHQFTATDTETPLGPFTWDQLTLLSYTPNYGGVGPGPVVAAGLSGTGLFSWVSEGAPRGDYVWQVRGTDPGARAISVRSRFMLRMFLSRRRWSCAVWR